MIAPFRVYWNVWRKTLMESTQGCCIQHILDKSEKRHLTKHQLCSHLPLISQTNQVNRTRYAGQSKDEQHKTHYRIDSFIYEYTSVGWPAKTCIHQLCEDTGCRLEDLPRSMTGRNGWRNKVKRICSVSTPG